MMNKTLRRKMIVAMIVVAAIAGVNPGIGNVAQAAQKKEVKTQTSVEKLYQDMDVEIENDEDSYSISGGGLAGFVEYDFSNKQNKKRKMAAKASRENDEYDDAVSNYVGRTMNQQMKAFLYDLDGKKAEAVNVYSDDRGTDANGAKSYIKFTLSLDKFGGVPTKQLVMGYLADAIAEYPNLCTLFTAMSATKDSENVYMRVASIYRVEKIKEEVEKYKRFLADIEALPKKNSSMSDEDILLYLYDRVALSAEYATKECQLEAYHPEYYKIHTPIEIVESGRIVCQSYAAVLNHLMKDMGFTSYNVWSRSHAWNAVKMHGSWYYFDVTWDDGQKDSVTHQFMYAKTSSFMGSHDLDAYYSQKLDGITGKFGSDYDGYFPKASGKTNPYYYVADRWVFMNGGVPCESRGSDFSDISALDIPSDSNRCIAVLANKLYYGGTDGIHEYNIDQNTSTNKYNTPVFAMYLFQNKVLVKTADKWKYFDDKSYAVPDYDESRYGGSDPSDDRSGKTPTPSPEPEKTPNPTPTPDPSGEYDDEDDDDDDRDGDVYEENRTPHFLVNASGKRGIKVRVYDMNPRGSESFEVQCAVSKSFDSGVKTKAVDSGSVKFKGLRAGKTYYVRVRAVNKQGNYSEWTIARKQRIKK